MNNEELKSNLLSGEHWMRLVFMILFAVLLYVAAIVMSFLVIVLFVFALVTGRANANLRQLGDTLSQFIYAVLRFLTYNTDDKPFPFAPWPTAEPIVEPEVVETPVVVEPAPVAETKPKAAKPKKPKAEPKVDTEPKAPDAEDDK
ncbi:MAG TPA: DUF4389 domain-containing protein [Cellvibrionaceae bacterium]